MSSLAPQPAHVERLRKSRAGYARQSADFAKRRKSSCMCLFRLETGVAVHVYIDFILFFTLLATASLSVKHILQVKDFKEKADLDVNSFNKDRTVFWFDFVTDYIMIFMMAIKVVFAFLYGYNLAWPGQMDEEFLMDSRGEEKWYIRVISTQRSHLQNYYMASVMFQRFSFVQCLCLTWIFRNQPMIQIKLGLFGAYSILLYVYLLVKMEQLIDQMNAEISEFYYGQNEEDEDVGDNASHHSGNSAIGQKLQNKIGASFNMFARQKTRLIAESEFEVVGDPSAPAELGEAALENAPLQTSEFASR